MGLLQEPAPDRQSCVIVVSGEIICTSDPPKDQDHGPFRVFSGAKREALEPWNFPLRDYEQQTVDEACLTIVVEGPWSKGGGTAESSEMAAYDVVCALAMFGAKVRSTLILTRRGYNPQLGPGPALWGNWDRIEPTPISSAMVVRALALACKVRQLAVHKDSMWRLHHVWTCFQKGLHEAGTGERLVQFFRAVEGCLPQPLLGKKIDHPGRQDWETRNGWIIKEMAPSIADEKSLVELLWEVRSKLVHLEDVRVIPGISRSGYSEQMADLSMRAEFIASHAVARILEWPDLFALQTNETAYRQALRDRGRRKALWGDPVSVESLFQQRKLVAQKNVGDGLTRILK